MLLRNLDQTEGLCNGIRLTVTNLEDHVIEAKIITEKILVRSITYPEYQ
jgi:ATP-dependent DNA helicase PIF1